MQKKRHLSNWNRNKSPVFHYFTCEIFTSFSQSENHLKNHFKHFDRCLLQTRSLSFKISTFKKKNKDCNAAASKMQRQISAKHFGFNDHTRQQVEKVVLCIGKNLAIYHDTGVTIRSIAILYARWFCYIFLQKILALKSSVQIAHQKFD